MGESKFAGRSMIEKLKRNRKDDLQALVAVHETGHAICYMFTQGKYPSKVFSVSSTAFTGGMMLVKNEDLLTVKS